MAAVIRTIMKRLRKLLHKLWRRVRVAHARCVASRLPVPDPKEQTATYWLFYWYQRHHPIVAQLARYEEKIQGHECPCVWIDAIERLGTGHAGLLLLLREHRFALWYCERRRALAVQLLIRMLRRCHDEIDDEIRQLMMASIDDLVAPDPKLQAIVHLELGRQEHIMQVALIALHTDGPRGDAARSAIANNIRRCKSWEDWDWH